MMGKVVGIEKLRLVCLRNCGYVLPIQEVDRITERRKMNVNLLVYGGIFKKA